MCYYVSMKIRRSDMGVFLFCQKGGDYVTPKQEKFCVEYLIDLNATQAAIRAGYSKRTAYSIGNEILKKPEIKSRINELRSQEFKKSIMTAEEVEARLSKAARGELQEEVVVTENIGDFMSKAKIIKKQISAKDQVKALELMGKRNNLFSADTQIDITPIIIKGEGDIRE